MLFTQNSACHLKMQSRYCVVLCFLLKDSATQIWVWEGAQDRSNLNHLLHPALRDAQAVNTHTTTTVLLLVYIIPCLVWWVVTYSSLASFFQAMNYRLQNRRNNHARLYARHKIFYSNITKIWTTRLWINLFENFHTWKNVL